MNERTVRDAFREAVVRHCNAANAGGTWTPETVLGVTVTTVEALSAATQEWIYELTRDHARQMLAATRDPVLAFPEDGTLPPPGHRFTFRAESRGAPRRPRGRPAPPGPVALLTLRYDPGFVWPCRIGAAEDWLALGRWTDDAAERAVAMRLPAYATWLPRGPLLLVHNRDRRFAFGRSGFRPQYEIRVDGVPLRAGGSVPAHERGSIEYARDGSSTRLTYRVGWEGRHDR